MTQPSIELNDIHWLMDILQNIDVGLVVLNRNYEIQLWNGFMESHSGLSPQQAKGQLLFELFPDIPADWFKKKAEPVFQLKTRTFTIWEQRPYLFHFGNYRPITGRATHMYQNTSIIPLESVDKSVDHICVIIYDATDIAVERMEADNQQQKQIAARDPYLSSQQWNSKLTESLANTRSTLILLELRSPAAQQSQASKNKIEKLIAQSLETSDYATRLSSHHIGLLLQEKNKSQALSVLEQLKARISHQLKDELDINIAAGIAESDCNFNGPQKWQKLAAENLRQYR